MKKIKLQILLSFAIGYPSSVIKRIQSTKCVHDMSISVPEVTRGIERVRIVHQREKEKKRAAEREPCRTNGVGCCGLVGSFRRSRSRSSRGWNSLSTPRLRARTFDVRFQRKKRAKHSSSGPRMAGAQSSTSIVVVVSPLAAFPGPPEKQTRKGTLTASAAARAQPRSRPSRSRRR